MAELPARKGKPLPASWTPRSLLDFDGPARNAPDKLGGLVYSDSLGILSGEPGAGKSMVTMAIAVENARQGKVTFFWDFERPGQLLLERLRLAGMSDEMIEEFIRYMHPVERMKKELVPAVMEAAGACDTMVIDSYDSALVSLGFAGKAGNPNDALEEFHIDVLEPIRTLSGACVILVDHVAKSKEGRGIYSVGGYRKLGRAEWHLGAEVLGPGFRRYGSGKLKFHVHKDNHGYLPRRAHPIFELASHPSSGALSWTVEIPKVSDESGWRPTIYMERVSRYLEQLSEAVSQRQVTSDVEGGSDYLKTALQDLVDEGFVEMSQGARGALMFRSVKAFRREDEEAGE